MDTDRLVRWQDVGLLNNNYGTLDIHGRMPGSNKGCPLLPLFLRAEGHGKNWFVVMFPYGNAFLWMRKEYLDQLTPYVEMLGSYSVYPTQAKETFWVAFYWNSTPKEKLVARTSPPEPEVAKRHDWKKIERSGWVGWFVDQPAHMSDTVEFLEEFDLSKYQLVFAVRWEPEPTVR